MLIGIEANHANKNRRGGVEEVCYRLIEHLKKIIPPETRVVLYSNAPLRKELAELPLNWTVKILPWPFKKLWSQCRLSLELLFNLPCRQAGPPDIFFAPGQLIPFFTPKKTVVFIHDSAFLFEPRSYRFWGRQYLKWMNGRIIKKASVILTSTEFNKKEMIKYYGEDISNKIKIAPLAYDSDKFSIPSSRDKFQDGVLDKYGIKRPYILSVGRLETKKNTARLVEAFNLLKSSFADIQLLLIGSPGCGYEKVKDAIEKSPFKKDIILPGHVERDDLPAFYAGAEVFAFPSLYEGFGLPVLEAMASGCPVVAANRTALPEVGGNAAIYVNSESAEDIARGLGEILNNQTLREEKIRLGLERVKQFSWDKSAREVAETLAAEKVYK